MATWNTRARPWWLQETIDQKSLTRHILFLFTLERDKQHAGYDPNILNPELQLSGKLTV